MPIMMFAAIDVGSYELAMKIFEFSKKNGMNWVKISRSNERLSDLMTTSAYKKP